MQDMQDMMRRLNQSGKRLSKGHRKIAEYIVEHYDKAVFMTASKLGEKVGVSESTVVRFASAMGYEGYPQLQRALQELVRHWLTAVQRFEMATDIDQSEVLRTVLHADMQNIRTTTEEIDTAAFDEVVDKIIGAPNIYVMGLRSAAPIAQFLAYYLNFIFDNVRVVSEASGDVFEQISRINESDLLFGISFPFPIPIARRNQNRGRTHEKTIFNPSACAAAGRVCVGFGGRDSLHGNGLKAHDHTREEIHVGREAGQRGDGRAD